MRLASCFSIIFLSVANRKQLLPGLAFGRLAVWLNGEWRPRGAHSAVSRGAAGSPGHHAVVRSSDHVYADAPLHAVPRFAIASSVPAGSGPYHDTSQEWISYASTNRYIFFENRWNGGQCPPPSRIRRLPAPQTLQFPHAVQCSIGLNIYLGSVYSVCIPHCHGTTWHLDVIACACVSMPCRIKYLPWHCTCTSCRCYRMPSTLT